MRQATISTPLSRLLMIGSRPANSSRLRGFFAIMSAFRRPQTAQAGGGAGTAGVPSRDEPQFLPLIKRLSYKTGEAIESAQGIDVIRIRHISTALLLMSLGLQVQAQGPAPDFTAAPAPSQPAPSQPAPSQPAAKGGINALLDSVKTSGDDFLPPDRAFRFDALPDGTDRVRLNWEIADGYYLYRARIKVVTPSPRAQLGAPQMPQGQIKTDEYFGRQEVYHHELVATVPVLRASGGAFELPLQVTYQGCAEAGLCYPPITKTVTVNLSAGATSSGTASAGSFIRRAGGGAEQDWFASLIRAGNPLVMLGWFYLAGLALAFTPCVLPMVPILSGIIAGGGRTLSTARAFALSVTYVLGMALTYTLAGIACAAAGRQVQAVSQQWWVLTLFAALFVLLAVAAWMLARIVPERVALSLWAVPALILAWLLWSQTRGHPAATWTLRAAGVIAGLYGVALTAGSALGGTDPLAPIPAFAAKARALPFRRIESVADLDREVARAKLQGRGVLVDFSAAWCTSCKEMERYTFTDPDVQAALSAAVLLRADVTQNDADDQALLKRFGIFGPPTIAFYGADGEERTQYRVVGYMKAQAFAARTRAALHTPP